MNLRRIFALFLIPIVSLLCAGCGMTGSIYSNYRPLEQLRLIQTLGYDTDGGGITLSASSGKQGESGDIILLRGRGDSILSAMDDLQDYTTQGQLFFSHINYVVVGREAAEHGVGALLDFAERDAGMRLDTELFVLREGSAGELVMEPGDDSYDITEVLSSVRQDIERRAAGHVGDIRETAAALSEYGAALVCLLRPVRTEGSVKLKADGLSAVPDGYGILKDGALAGILDVSEAEAVSLLLGYPGTASRTVSDGAGGSVTLRFDAADSALEPGWNADGSPGPVEVRLRVRAAIAETDSERTRMTRDPAYLEALSAQLCRSLESDLRGALSLSRALDADFFALGRALRLSGGSRFRALPDGWLTALEFHVRVEADIDRSYDLDDLVRMNGGKRG